MMRPDLHLHSTASDGASTPHELARLVQRSAVTLFSLTDHDTLAGLAEAADAADERGLPFIPGVEISTEGEDEVHILGYGVRHDDPVLTGFFEAEAQARAERLRAMGRKLEKMGYALPLDDILAGAGACVGRPHLARALTDRGYVRDAQEAFDRLLGRGCPAYVPREAPSASRAISLLRERGAVPVLAHPALIRWPAERMGPMLKAWQDAGLMGVEVYHPANRDVYPLWDRWARERGLLVTGGSDYHDGSGAHGRIGETIDAWRTAGEDAWALFQAARKAARSSPA
ncbi:MAG: PHP domain-containing protein [Clostridiales bacterium]|nr:PHP domain-containing protein [Clostridiales bacterium]